MKQFSVGIPAGHARLPSNPEDDQTIVRLAIEMHSFLHGKEQENGGYPFLGKVPGPIRTADP
jgi:hypothetical protein